MTSRELFGYLSPVVAPTLEALYKRRDLCVFSTRVVIEVAKYFDIEARPLTVHAVAYNRPFAAHVQDNFADVDVAHWKPLDGSYSVGIGFGAGGTPYGNWAGHLAVVAGDTFGDFSIQQAERREQGILTGPAIVCEFDDSMEMWRWEHPSSGTTVEYVRERELPNLKIFPDWTVEARRRQLVGKLIRYVRDTARFQGIREIMRVAHGGR